MLSIKAYQTKKSMTANNEVFSHMSGISQRITYINIYIYIYIYIQGESKQKCD